MVPKTLRHALKIHWNLTNVQQHLTVTAQTSVHLPASASQGCSYPKELPQAEATYNCSMASERIQSESSTLGANGQYLLHRVESHGWWLIGEAMTDSLEDMQKDEKRHCVSISVCISQQGCCFVWGCHTPDCDKQMAHMDVESVMKQKCKALNCEDKRKLKRNKEMREGKGWNALSMHRYPVFRARPIFGFTIKDPFIIVGLFWEFFSLISVFISISFSQCLPHEVVITLKSGNKIYRKHINTEHCCRDF